MSSKGFFDKNLHFEFCQSSIFFKILPSLFRTIIFKCDCAVDNESGLFGHRTSLMGAVLQLYLYVFVFCICIVSSCICASLYLYCL